MGLKHWLVAVSVLAALVVGVGCSSVPGAAPEAKFPTKQINAICTGAPGGAHDIFQRALAKVLQKEWGVAIAMENQPEGQTATAYATVLSKPADGYTYAGMTKSTLVQMGLEQLGSITSASQLHMLAILQSDPCAIAVKGNAPWKNWAELQDHAKKNPGKVTVGGALAMSVYSVGAEQTARKAGIEWKYIAYEGQAQANKALLGDEIQVHYGSVGSLLSFAKAGDARILAVTTDKRIPSLPDAPTLKEVGVDTVNSQWRGVLVKPGLPANVLEVYYSSLKKAAKDPEVVDVTQKQGMLNLEDVGPQVQQTFLKEFEDIKATLATMK